MSDLDLLMMTQGWRRYDMKDILTKRYPDIRYGIEETQSISGIVESAKKKKPRHLQLVMFNPQTLKMETFDLGDSLSFTISGIDYMEGETLTIEASKASGSTKGLTLKLDQMDIPYIQASSAQHRTLPEFDMTTKNFAIQSEKHRMYMNADRMIELPNVDVKGTRRTWRNRRKMVNRGIAEGDSKIEHFANMESMIRALGIIVRMDADGKPYFGKQTPTFIGEEEFTLTPIYIDDMPIEQEELWNYLPTQVSQIEYLTPNDPANIIYSSEAVTAGCLLVYLKDGIQKTKNGYVVKK